jgi:hypothetical protein
MEIQPTNIYESLAFATLLTTFLGAIFGGSKDYDPTKRTPFKKYLSGGVIALGFLCLFFISIIALTHIVRVAAFFVAN